jgi:hypothetical protein
LPDQIPDLLPAWLAAASSGDETRQQAIRAGVATIVEATTAETLDMTLLAHGVPQPAAAARVAHAVTEHDPTFEGNPSYLQTQIAAAWTVAQMLGQPGDPGVTAALAVASAAFCGLSPRGPELTAMATSTLRERDNDSRGRLAIPTGRLQASVITDEIAALGAIDGAQLKQTADALTASINSVVRAQAAVTGILNKRLSALDEEADMLWWTLTERHEGDRERWPDLGAAASVLAGRDLARMTAFSTPPTWARQLLERTLVNVKPCGLKEAASALPAEAADEVSQHPLIPIRALARGADSAAVDVDIARQPPEIAEQALRESLLERKL